MCDEFDNTLLNINLNNMLNRTNFELSNFFRKDVEVKYINLGINLYLTELERVSI